MIPQLEADLGGDVRQFGQIVDREILAAGLFGEFAQHARTTHFLRRAAARSHGLINADGIDLHVGFADGVTNFALRVAAGVVASVGNNQDRLARIAKPSSYDSSPCRRRPAARAAFGLGEREAVLNFFRIGRHADHQFRTVVKTDQEKLVLRVRGFHKLRDGLP